MDGADRALTTPASTFYAPGAWTELVELGESAAHHARVKRLVAGDVVRLTSGDGRLVVGRIRSLERRCLTVVCDPSGVRQVAPEPYVELWAPVGDRDRTLWLAEKSVELGVSAWRSVAYRRSRSVTPRGEGEAFREKLQLRMIAALEQSGGAWLPAWMGESDCTPELIARAAPCRVLLDAGANSWLHAAADLRPPVVLAVGPEGGLEPDERAGFVAEGWRLVSLGSNVLRFETAGIAAVALARASLR